MGLAQGARAVPGSADWTATSKPDTLGLTALARRVSAGLERLGSPLPAERVAGLYQVYLSSQQATDMVRSEIDLDEVKRAPATVLGDAQVQAQVVAAHRACEQLSAALAAQGRADEVPRLAADLHRALQGTLAAVVASLAWHAAPQGGDDFGRAPGTVAASGLVLETPTEHTAHLGSVGQESVRHQAGSREDVGAAVVVDWTASTGRSGGSAPEEPDPLIAAILARYPTQDSAHGLQHAVDCLGHLAAIGAAEPELPAHELKKARLAVALHDLGERHGVATDLAQLLSSDPTITPSDIDDIRTAIEFHNQPRISWRNPDHLTTRLLYDADKMDTKPQRFIVPVAPELDPTGQNRDRFYYYVLMVRDSATSPVARSALTRLLPAELQIDPIDPSVSGEAVVVLHNRLHRLWQVATMPAKRTVAKLMLQCTANRNFTRLITEQMGPRPAVDTSKMPAVQREQIERIAELEATTRYIVDHLDTLLELCGDNPMVARFPKQQFSDYLTEKLWVYDMYLRALQDLPESRARELEILYRRTPELIHENYQRFEALTAPARSKLGAAEYARRRQHFDTLLGNRLEVLEHWAKFPQFETLYAANELRERESGSIRAALGADTVLEAAQRIIEGESDNAMALMTYLIRSSLRAVDRVNDVFGTDNYIYFLLEQQETQAPVWRLPYRYVLHQPAVQAHNDDLNYSSPTHPQIIHDLRLHSGLLEMPQVYQDSISMYANGLYRPEDFKALYAEIFSLTCRPEEVDQELFDFVFRNVKINEESKLFRLDEGRWIAPEWLELNFAQKGHPRFREAQEIVTRINDICAQYEIIPPNRPYVVAGREIDLGAVGVEVYRNHLVDPAHGDRLTANENHYLLRRVVPRDASPLEGAAGRPGG